MPVEIIMRREGARLAPVDPGSADDLSRVPKERDVLVTVRSPRNLKQMRYIWALAQKVAEARDDLPDKDAAMDALCELARHVDVSVNPITGTVHITRRSLANLDAAQMSRLIDRMVFIVCNTIIPGLPEGDLRSEVESMIAPSPNQRLR